MQKAWNKVRNVDSQGKDLGTNWNFVLALHLHKICQKQRVKRLQMFICEVLNHDIEELVMKTSFYVISHFFVIFCLRSEIKRPMRFLNSWMECHHLEKLGSGRVSALIYVYVWFYICIPPYIYDLILASREMEADQFRVTMATKKAPGQPRLNEILSQI